jgi:hypothetical protein
MIGIKQKEKKRTSFSLLDSWKNTNRHAYIRSNNLQRHTSLNIKQKQKCSPSKKQKNHAQTNLR